MLLLLSEIYLAICKTQSYHCEQLVSIWMNNETKASEMSQYLDTVSNRSDQSVPLLFYGSHCAPAEFHTFSLESD